MLRRFPIRGLLLCVALFSILLLSGCASGTDTPQSTIDPAGSAADQIHDIYNLLWVLAAIVFVLVEGGLLYVLFRFRSGARKANGRPVPVHGNTRLEIIWTVIPAIILVIIAIPTLQGIVNLSGQEDGFRVNVIGNQFFWQFEYPDIIGPDGNPVMVSGNMNIPVNTRIDITLMSNDVIHSFWVPRLNGKTDVIPGRHNHMWLEADEVGTYSGQCAEFCGLGHALMRFNVVAQEQSEFNSWVASQTQPPEDQAAAGLDIVQTICSSCHTVAGTSAAGTVGPELTHIASSPMIAGVLENNPDNLRRWLENPPAIKPGTIMPDLPLTDQQISSVIAYLETLK